MCKKKDVKRSGNNKPPLCRDLEPALRDVYSSAAVAEVTGMSIELERGILKYAISRPKELDRLNGPIIDELPTGDGASSAAYASRFINGELWRGMLGIVRHRLGPAHIMHHVFPERSCEVAPWQQDLPNSTIPLKLAAVKPLQRIHSKSMSTTFLRRLHHSLTVI